MSGPHQPEQSSGEEGSGQDRALTESRDQAGAGATQPSADAQPTEGADVQAHGARLTGSGKGLLLGLGGSALVAASVALVVAAFVWPGFLGGPGTPDDTAAAATAALAGENPGELDEVSCHGADGRPTAQVPPDALELIHTATQTGPPHLSLDTQAKAPVDLTVNMQGQTQTLPADVLLGVTDGEWCMSGIAQRQ